GTVHASNTSSRGASKTRTIRMPSASLWAETTPSCGASSVMSCSLLALGLSSDRVAGLDLAEVLVEPVEAGLPEPPVVLQPRRGVPERLGGPRARQPLARS